MKTKGGEVIQCIHTHASMLSVTQFHGKVHGWLFIHSTSESAHIAFEIA